MSGWRLLHDHFSPGIGQLPESREQIRLSDKNDVSRLADRSVTEADQVQRRPIDVDNPIGQVQHNNAVGHIVHDCLARHRHQIKQSIAADSPGQRGPGQNKTDRRIVQTGDGTEVQDIDHTARPGDERSQHHRQCLTTIHAGSQKRIARQDESGRRGREIQINDNDPERRAMLVDQQVFTQRVGLKAGPDPSVYFVSPSQADGNHGQNEGSHHGTPVKPTIAAGKIQGKHQQQRRTRHRAQILQLGPEDFGRNAHGRRFKSRCTRVDRRGHHQQG